MSTILDPERAWLAYAPDASRPWTLALAGHLFRRAAFGANAATLKRAVQDGPQRTIDRLCSPGDTSAFEGRMASLESPVAHADTAASDEAAQLWIYRMLASPDPWRERMTLLWHRYFAIAGSRAANVSLMLRHVALLRGHALGRFDVLLRDLMRDPAALLASGARACRLGRPPEEFAATLHGWAGLKAPADVARAFTGIFVLQNEYRYLPHEHDGSARQSGDEVVNGILANPATASYVVRHLYRQLIAESGAVPEALIAPLARTFARDYDIGRLTSTMLRSNLFFSEAAYRQRIKSPIEYAVGLAAALEASPAPAAVHRHAASLGERLLEPPTRSGWAGGRRWLNQFTVVRRAHVAGALVGEPKASLSVLWDVLLQGDAPADVRSGLAKLTGRQLALALVTLPEYQLA